MSTEGFAEGKSRKIDSSFVTDNWKAKRKAQKQKEAEISRELYAEVARNTTGKDVDFYRIYENFVKDENSNSCLIKTSPPVMYTNSADVTNHCLMENFIFCTVFVMNLQLNLVLRLHLIPNLRGNLLMAVLVWNFF